MNKESLVAYLRTRAEISLAAEEEDIPVRGNALASGDAATDKEVEDRIIEDYNGGNVWAWCCAHVEAKWGTTERSAYLGGCSYKSAADFKTSGYYDGMVTEALEMLADQLIADHAKFSELEKELGEEFPLEAYAEAADFIETCLGYDSDWFKKWHLDMIESREDNSDAPPPEEKHIEEALRRAVSMLRKAGQEN